MNDFLTNPKYDVRCQDFADYTLPWQWVQGQQAYVWLPRLLIVAAGNLVGLPDFCSSVLFGLSAK